MSDPVDTSSHPRRGRRARIAAAAAALLGLGGVAGALAVAETRPPVTMAPATPVAIRSLSSGGIVTIRGRVAEIFGNSFVIADATGRALVDTGRAGDERALVAVGAPVTVQGRFDRGIMRAAFLVGADNKAVALGPIGGPRHGPHGGPEGGPRRGPRADGPHDGPDGRADHGPGAPPPPPPIAGGAVGSPPSVVPPVGGAASPAAAQPR